MYPYVFLAIAYAATEKVRRRRRRWWYVGRREGEEELGGFRRMVRFGIGRVARRSNQDGARVSVLALGEWDVGRIRTGPVAVGWLSALGE